MMKNIAVPSGSHVYSPKSYVHMARLSVYEGNYTPSRAVSYCFQLEKTVSIRAPAMQHNIVRVHSSEIK